MSNEYALHCVINPNRGQLKASGTIVIPTTVESAFFILNRGLRWTKTIRRTASGDQKITAIKTDIVEVPKFYNGDLWTFDIKGSEQDEFVLEVEYSGQIHPPVKESSMPQMGYIKKNFVELACYSAWYPVPFNMETNMSYEITLESPEDWTWKANARLQRVEEKEKKSVWRWKQSIAVNDIVVVGLPKHNAFLDKESLFWGPKDIVGSQKILDKDARAMKKKLEEWLGPKETNASVRFAVTPRKEGGAYARTGLIIVGGGYSTDIKLRRQVLQAMCHEVCHDWFNRASVRTYDNWLDEALAEYCSTVVTDDFHEGFLDWRVGRTKEILEKQGHLPSIRSLTRDQDEAYATYYFRGFLLIHHLSEQVDSNQFRDNIGKFAQVCVKNKIVTTDMFLEFIEQHLGKTSRKLVDKWLDFDGVGIPS